MEDKPVRILASGATGLIGSRLVSYLENRGHTVARLTRSPKAAGDIRWDPDKGEIDRQALNGFDAVIHLAGENLFGRWTPEKKHRIIESREKSTRLLSQAIAELDGPPEVMVSASAIGYYGSRGNEVLSETSSPGFGFLPEVCGAWESATEPAREAGVRVANARFGVVLASEGGALEKMLTPFKLGVGGKLGSGKQWMSWIDIDDLCRAIEHVILTESLAGPINFVAPEPVTNEDFTRTLARVLGKPAALTVPEFAIRIAFGEMGEETVLASQRVLPDKLVASGFGFNYPTVRASLTHVLEST